MPVSAAARAYGEGNRERGFQGGSEEEEKVVIKFGEEQILNKDRNQVEEEQA